MSQTDRNERIGLLLSAGVLFVTLLRIRFLGDIRVHVPETITLLVLAGLFYLFSCYLVLRRSNGAKSYRLGLGIVAVGVIFRLIVWPLAPALSDDPYRYRWEGKLQAAGANPYEARPVDLPWMGLRDATYRRIPGKDFKAVYGPLIELMERWTYRAVDSAGLNDDRQVLWFKLPFALCDLGVMAALWWLLAAHGLPRERILIYAWSPLAVIEFWAAGHNDSVVALCLTLALVAAARNRWTWAFAALSLATAAKIWPILLFPLFIGWRRYRPLRRWQWCVLIPIAVLLALPYWTNVAENLQFMSGFMGGWRNNDSLYGLILWAAKDLYRAKCTAFAIVAVTVAALSLREIPLARASLWAIALMLMVSANCHPWYLTWLLPLLALLPVPGLLLWTALAPLAYSAVVSWITLGEWQGSDGFRWFEYAPVYALLTGSWLASWLRTRRRLPDSSAHTAG